MAIRVIDDTKLQNIAVAIQSKDNGGQMTVDEMAGRIEAIPTDHHPDPKKVNFYTFKNLAYSYTIEEAMALTEMPEPPTIEGFIFQKWGDWTVEKIKTWLDNNNLGALNIGGFYVTTDGHTRIKMHLRDPQMESLPMPFCIQQMEGTVVIDWGDGSAPETITTAGIYYHTWQVNQYPSNVVIDITYMPSDLTKLVLGYAVGSTAKGLFYDETYYASCVTEVEYGENNDFTDYSATFKNCMYLKTINIPFDFNTIGYSAFYNCADLALIILPDELTAIRNSTFSGCSSLFSINLLNGLTIVENSAFFNCTNLALIILPDELTAIGGYAFSGCSSLSSIVLPNNLTIIGGSAFSGCKSLYFINLTQFTNPQSIPTLANANAFNNIPRTAQFQVINQEMYDAFTTATNWSTYASKFVIKGAA